MYRVHDLLKFTSFILFNKINFILRPNAVVNFARAFSIGVCGG
jgi:hypothetical protein